MSDESLGRVYSLRRGLARQKVVIYDSFAFRPANSDVGEADTGQLWKLISGNWRVDGTSLLSETGTDMPAMLGQDLGTNQMKFQVDVSNAAGAGLFFRYKDKNNYMALRIEEDQLVLHKYKAGVTYKMGSFAYESTTDMITLSVVQDGDSILASVNSTTAITLNDGDFMDYTIFGLISPSADPLTGAIPPASVEYLGTPSNKASYARNVWDMQLFDDKIYIGQGNSSNSPPAAKAGPNPIVYYDLVRNQFVTEKVNTVNPATGAVTAVKTYVDEEQIDRYRAFDDDRLYIPGHDATESSSFANFYFKNRNEDQWTKYRNIPQQYHVYDIYRYRNVLFAAGNRSGRIDPNKQETGSDVLRSDNNGATWYRIGDTAIGDRAYNFFELRGKLYASGLFMPLDSLLNSHTRILTINEDLSLGYTLFTGTLMMPDIKKLVPSNTLYCRISRPINSGDKLLYLYGEVTNDHQIKERAMAVASDVNQAVRVVFPDANAIPTDIINRNGKTYVLTYTRHSAGDYTIRVYQSADLTSWEEVLHFKQNTFAKSFEEYNGTFYFGLGTDTTSQSSSSGKILRIPSQPVRTVRWNDFQASLL